jgi:hypothetical protein
MVAQKLAFMSTHALLLLTVVVVVGLGVVVGLAVVVGNGLHRPQLNGHRVGTGVSSIK